MTTAVISVRYNMVYSGLHSLHTSVKITDDGVHVTLGWSEFMGGYNILDTAMKHRRESRS